MADAQALVRVLDELVWTLRREGFPVSTAEAVELVRAVRAVGMEHGREVRQAVACVVVQRAGDRARFDAAFDAFFAPAGGGRGASLWDRLSARGFSEMEMRGLRDFLTALGPIGGGQLGVFLEGGADLDRLLVMSGVARALDGYSGSQLGYRTHRLLRELGAGASERTLMALRSHLVEVLGQRGAELGEALAEELERGHDRVRAYVRGRYDACVADLQERRAAGGVLTTPFASLSDDGIEAVRRAVRRFAERLRGGARVRNRRALRGAIDPHRTLRQSLRTGGVPMRLARRRRLRDRPKLMLLCDVSDSVRAAASFLLEFTYAAQELFEGARSFVFVSEVGEITSLFGGQSPSLAVAHAWQGAGLIRASDNSNYGRALRAFEARVLGTVDRRTTVVIIGDGRTNYGDAAADVLDRIRARARALLWMCPEPRGLWTEGDSAMANYAPRCTAVYEVGCAADLERAARAMMVAHRPNTAMLGALRDG